MKKDAYRRIPNLNLLPEELRPRLLTRQQWFLLLVFFVELLLLLYLYRGWVDRKDEVDFTQSQIRSVQRELSQYSGSQQEAQELGKSIEALKKQTTELQGDYQTLAPRRVNWSDFLLHLHQAIPPGVTVTSIDQKGLDVSVIGRAPDFAAPVSFRNALLQSPLVSSVVPPSMKWSGSTREVNFSLVVRVKPGGG